MACQVYIRILTISVIGAVVYAQICNEQGYAVCVRRYNTAVNGVTDANRKCTAYNNLVLCARSFNCLVNPEIPNQCSTDDTCQESAYNVCENIHSVATKFTSNEDTLCTAYRALVICAIAANCLDEVDEDDNPCPPPCQESDYTPCETTYTNAISGVSINDTATRCSAYTTLVACASNVNCEDSIRVTSPCSTGTQVAGSIVLALLLFTVQLFKNI